MSWERRLNPAQGLSREGAELTDQLKPNWEGAETPDTPSRHTQPLSKAAQSNGFPITGSPLHPPPPRVRRAPGCLVLLHRRARLPASCAGHPPLQLSTKSSPATAQALGNPKSGRCHRTQPWRAAVMVHRKGDHPSWHRRRTGPPVLSLLDMGMTSGGLALTSVPVPSCRSWKALMPGPSTSAES